MSQASQERYVRHTIAILDKAIAALDSAINPGAPSQVEAPYILVEPSDPDRGLVFMGSPAAPSVALLPDLLTGVPRYRMDDADQAARNFAAQTGRSLLRINARIWQLQRLQELYECREGLEAQLVTIPRQVIHVHPDFCSQALQ
ncbi:hypothetical protein [Pseudomonas sp. KCJK9000]|uniref:hypothetical protein n=1 Tax=Pseudomonas sp. KCJK9000 TaxID=3344566 RepID=UPI003905EEFA